MVYVPRSGSVKYHFIVIQIIIKSSAWLKLELIVIEWVDKVFTAVFWQHEIDNRIPAYFIHNRRSRPASLPDCTRTYHSVAFIYINEGVNSGRIEKKKKKKKISRIYFDRAENTCTVLLYRRNYTPSDFLYSTEPSSLYLTMVLSNLPEHQSATHYLSELSKF